MKIALLSIIAFALINSSPTEIAESLKPKNSKIVHSVIQANFSGATNVIIAFYETKYTMKDKYKTTRQFVEGYLLIPDGKNRYKKTLINKFEDDNVDSKIESIFFANVDKDKDKELVIISTVQHNLQGLYEGTEYGITAYDTFDINHIPKQLSKLNMPVESGFEGYTEETPNSHAKFKNADAVKKELKRLGY